MYNNEYMENGIIIKPNVINEGDRVSIVYRGLLSQSGADSVYAHIGFGDGPNWQYTSFVKMDSTSEGFETTVKVNQQSNLNIAFKDSANNWDNNNGNNYVFNVQSR